MWNMWITFKNTIESKIYKKIVLWKSSSEMSKNFN